MGSLIRSTMRAERSAEIRALIRGSGLTHAEVAVALGVARETVDKWALRDGSVNQIVPREPMLRLAREVLKPRD